MFTINGATHDLSTANSVDTRATCNAEFGNQFSNLALRLGFIGFIAFVISACGGVAAPTESPGNSPNDQQVDNQVLSDACKPEFAGDLTKFASLPVMRRITADQYLNALAELTGSNELNLEIDPDPTPEGNVILADELQITRQWVIDSEKNAWQVAPDILRQVEQDLNCSLQNDQCLDQALSHLALRIWRKPLSNIEKTRMQNFAASIEQQFDRDSVGEAVIAAFLQSPQFSHRSDIPKGERVGAGTRRLDDFQIAESLAFFLWRSLPDEALLEAAKQGELSTDEGLKAVVERMLNHPRAARATNHFVDQWLDISLLEITNKNEGGWNEAMARAARLDTEKVFAQIMLNPESTFGDLFSHQTAYLTPEIAPLYDVAMQDGEDGQFTSLSSEQRRGILTHSSFLTAHSKVTGASAIKRGNSVLKQLMCQDLDLPEDIIIPAEPDHTVAKTARERLAIHRDSPACVICHEYIDAPGLALELWDGIGRARTHENGVAIDPSGDLFIPGKSPMPFNTPEQMFDLLGREPAIQACFSRRWYAEATATTARAAKEPCGYEVTAYVPDDSQLNLRDFLSKLAQHPSFWLREEL